MIYKCRFSACFKVFIQIHEIALLIRVTISFSPINHLCIKLILCLLFNINPALDLRLQIPLNMLYTRVGVCQKVQSFNF